jgi:hypothetical protein
MRPEARRAGVAGVAGVAEATKGLQDVVACFQYFSTLHFFKISKTSEAAHYSPDSSFANSNARGGVSRPEGATEATVSARETVGGGDRGGVSRSKGGADEGGDRGEHGSCNRDATAATAMQDMQQPHQGDEGTDGVRHAAQGSMRKDAQGSEHSVPHIIMLCPITQVTRMLTYADACGRMASVG